MGGLKEGKIYTTRSGLITSPMRLTTTGGNYKFEAEVNEPEHKGKPPTVGAWKENGVYLHNSIEHKLDIILNT